MLATDIARLMQQIPQEDEAYEQQNNGSDMDGSHGGIQGGAFDGYNESPFGVGRGEGVDAGRGETEWVVEQNKYKYDESFEKLGPVDGKISGAVAKREMVKSKLPNTTLGKIWKLSDLDRDGYLDADEWALAQHLIQIKLDNHDLPAELPDHLIPPSKRKS